VRLPGLVALDADDRAKLSGILQSWGVLPAQRAAE